MSNLKTLKDITKCPDCNCIDESCVDYRILREEAIKHIKKLERRILELVGTGKSDWILQNNAIINWIKHFFNITNEDLK